MTTALLDAPAGRTRAATMSQPAVWLGFASSSLAAVGELRRVATQPAVQDLGWAAWLSESLTAQQGVWLTLLGIGVLSLSWVLLRPGVRPPGNLAVVAALWVAPLIVLPPMLSTDAGSYADLGWMVWQGSDPYSQGLGTTGSPFAYGRAWRGTTSVYPPLALQLFGWIVGATQSHWYWSVVALRLLALIGLGLLLWAVPRLAREAGTSGSTAVWLAVLNPVTLIHGVGGEHIDLLMAGLVCAGLALAVRRPGWWLGALVIGLAAAVKQPALVALPTVAGLWAGPVRRRWHWVCAGVAGAALGVGVLLGAGLVTGLGSGWLAGTGDPASSPTPTLGYLLAAAWTGIAVPLGLGQPSGLASLLTGAVQGMALVAVAWSAVFHGRRHPLRFAAVAATAFVASFGAFREWYLILPLALIAVAGPSRKIQYGAAWVAVVFACYGCFREYLRWQILPSVQVAALIGVVVLALGIGLQRLARVLPAPVAAG